MSTLTWRKASRPSITASFFKETMKLKAMVVIRSKRVLLKNLRRRKQLLKSFLRERFITIWLEFDNTTKIAERRKSDKLATVRNLFDSLVCYCQLLFTLSEYSTMDEMQHLFTSPSNFNQYIPNKPARYGIKIFD